MGQLISHILHSQAPDCQQNALSRLNNNSTVKNESIHAKKDATTIENQWFPPLYFTINKSSVKPGTKHETMNKLKTMPITYIAGDIRGYGNGYRICSNILIIQPINSISKVYS